MPLMKKPDYQPPHLHSVTPYLMVDNVQALIEFTEKVYGARLNYKLKRPDGGIMHAEITLGDSVIMAGEPTDGFGAFPCSLYLYVEDCDAVYLSAIAYGCSSVMEPATMRHAGERYGGVRDPSGNIWWIATHVEDLTPEEQVARIRDSKGED